MVVHGNVDLSSALVRELLWRRLDRLVQWLAGTRWLIQATSRLPNGQARIRQQAMSVRLSALGSENPGRSRIQATLLRRNGGGTSATTSQLQALGRQTLQVSSLPDLFALEGRAAQIYFDFPSMLEGTEAEGILEAGAPREAPLILQRPFQFLLRSSAR